jgi:hypothetical protein
VPPDRSLAAVLSTSLMVVSCSDAIDRDLYAPREPTYCKLVGCPNVVTVDLSGALAVLEGHYPVTLHVCHDAACRDLRLDQDASECAPPITWEGDACGWYGSGDVLTITVGVGDAWAEDGGPAVVSVEFRTGSGQALFEFVGSTPLGTPRYANGPHCGATCFSGRLEGKL